jgi:hypothetical protein
MSGCKVKLNRDSGKKTAASLDFPISFYCPTESLLMFFPEQAACVLLVYTKSRYIAAHYFQCVNYLLSS